MARLYAIVSSMERARFMLAGGVPWLQLRFKQISLAPFLPEIKTWSTRYPHTRVVINDDQDFALESGVWGCHLGQEDLAAFPPLQLRADLRPDGLGLGISTHSFGELAAALVYRPDYVAFGPIFSTGTKQMAHPPQGLARLKAMVAQAPLPVVAIGGITFQNLPEVSATEVDSVAMIAALDGISDLGDLKRIVYSMT
ncbi:MAG: thiamine phosphate synthase [Deltaproteobacteria bacterium]|nr:thiamine phosphate synthase [Deltaproteobacteria bacterium]